MKKKVLALCLGAVMAVSSLAGCGGETSSEQPSDESQGTSGDVDEADESASASQDPGEIVEIIWQFPAQSDPGEAFYRMEDALNEMLERDIGVHVTFETTDLTKSQNDATLMVSAGEQLDICLTAFTSVGNLVDKGLVIPLDELLQEYGQDIIEHSATLDLCTYDNKVYGVTTGDITHKMYAFNMKKRFAEKYDCLPDDNKIYTFEELEAIFDKIKEGEGDNFLCTVPWNNTYEPLNYNLMEYDLMGGDMSWGVLMLNRSFEDTTIYNLFETQEYADYCDMAYRWAQKGFISPDAAVTSDSPDDILRRENVLGTFAFGAPTNDMLEVASWGEDAVQFKTVDAFVPGGTAPIMWNIPITSANPEKAIEALNYIYKNKEAAWLIQYGFEGEEWERVEEEGDNVLVRYLSDDPNNRAYVNPYGIWGDRLEWIVFEPNPIDSNQRKRDFEDAIPDSRKSPAIGYAFKADQVTAEIAAIQTVIAQYAVSLNCGVVDPSKALPEFISALKDAGIDKVIAENQKQFDEYLSLQ